MEQSSEEGDIRGEAGGKGNQSDLLCSLKVLLELDLLLCCQLNFVGTQKHLGTL